MKTQNKLFPENRKTQLQKCSGLCRSAVPRTTIHLRNYAVYNSNPFFIEERFDHSALLSDQFHFPELLRGIFRKSSRGETNELISKL